MKQLINQKDANEIREIILKEQNYTCPITGYRLTMDNSVLDHCHYKKTVRGVLYRGANLILQENSWVRYGVPREEHPNVLRNAANYIEREHYDIIHHSAKPKRKIIKKSSYEKLGKEILLKSGKLPSWWGYVKKGKKNAQYMSKRLEGLYLKYNIIPEYYK